MKKILPWIIGLVSILILTGCSGNSIKDTLTADGGKWKLKYNSMESDHMKFYEDGNIEFLVAGQVAKTGTYEVKEKEKRIVISLPQKKKIFNDIEIKNGDISLEYGDKKLTMEKEE
ncbi:lipoprotein [Enterococcus faecalis]|nr:lipoprotein [Enterococcus faecalis]